MSDYKWVDDASTLIARTIAPLHFCANGEFMRADAYERGNSPISGTKHYCGLMAHYEFQEELFVIDIVESPQAVHRRRPEDKQELEIAISLLPAVRSVVVAEEAGRPRVLRARVVFDVMRIGDDPGIRWWLNLEFPRNQVAGGHDEDQDV